ncbi:MAG: phosphatidate cytidylyltransferase [Candidatus Omnitrophica bacterium]|nr:phosphatidate cytidylyltransferase [Candidatus Omnitrophota bacterium]
MKQLPQRLASAAVLTSIVLAALFAAPVWAFALVVMAFIGVALFEFFTMVRHRGILVHRPLGVGLGLMFAGLVAWRSLVAPGRMTAPMLGMGGTWLSWGWDIFWPATIVIIFLRQFTRQNTFEALSGLATTLFGLAYISGLFSYLFYLRGSKAHDGAWLIFFLILVTKMGDVGAFTIGNLMGRHTLMPRISPRKTVEGFVGAVLLSGITALLARGMVWDLDRRRWLALGAGVLLGVFGQLGDLAESLIKRDCQVKDSGRWLPGMGGALDVIDSLLFTAPLFYGILIYG